MSEIKKKKIALIGGGPSALFMYKRLVEAKGADYDIHIFERKNKLGAGMPYSEDGACAEHITNVSDNEIPEIVCSIEDWVKTNPPIAAEFNINASNFNEYKVLPRLLFGSYLNDQFEILIKKATEYEIDTTLHLSVIVDDLIYKDQLNQVWVKTHDEIFEFDIAIICIGHLWPKKFEGKIDGVYDSPYPPSKISLNLNHAVAIKGSSLTAIDAIRTLSRKNGTFIKDENGKQKYLLNKENEDFKIMMHSRNGLLPAVRFHLDDSHLQNDCLLTSSEILAHRNENDGFLSLDYIFEKDFKELFKVKESEFYNQIKDLNLEDFVLKMMALRDNDDAFLLLKNEYLEAEQSIKQRKSIYWKELLGVLSFAMNQPAKHFSAEDMLRLKKNLMPLISTVIAYVPQSSCEDLMALHDAGIIDITAVGEDSEVIPQENGGVIYTYRDVNNKTIETYYETFIDCVGQAHLSYEDFPFKSFVDHQTISQALIKFKSLEKGKSEMDNDPDSVVFYKDAYYLKVSGITINDNFQIVDEYGALNKSIYIMSVPYISGFNPDYSGLDFCESASEKIINSICYNIDK